MDKFSKTKRTKDGYQGWCKECVSIHAAASYAEAEAFAYRYLGGKCTFAECTCADWDMLTYHHKNEALKINTIGSMMCVSHKRFVAELDKCVLLCGNHHLKTHALQKRKANEAQYQKAKVIPFPTKHRGAQAPPNPRPAHPAVCHGQLRDHQISG